MHARLIGMIHVKSFGKIENNVCRSVALYIGYIYFLGSKSSQFSKPIGINSSGKSIAMNDGSRQHQLGSRWMVLHQMMLLDIE